MTNERKRLNHFKNNKENTDYITVLDISLVKNDEFIETHNIEEE